MRAFVIAALMTALVAGLGFVLAPAPALRGPASAAVGEAGGALETGAAPEAAGASAEPAGSGKSVFYQWTDERGVVRFARSLAEVPAAWRDRAGQVEVDVDAFRPRSAPARRAAGSEGAGTTAADTRPRYREVTVYTTSWCGWCRKTLAWLDARGVEYVNKDIEANPDYAAELVEKSGARSIPFVEIDGAQIRGFNPRAMSTLLD
jgi:glutaredoxin